MTALSTYNPAKMRPFPGDVFLTNYPTANPGSDLTPANVIKGYFGLFYTDGNKKQGTPLLSPWAILKSDGMVVDPKFKTIETESNQPIPKIVIGFYPDTIEIDITILDPSRDKLFEALSGLTGHKIDAATGVGQPAQAGLMLGAQCYVTPYVFMFRSPSPKFAGCFDHFLTPKTIIDPSSVKLEFVKSKGWELKLKLRPLGDDYLHDAASTTPVWGYFEETVGAPS